MTSSSISSREAAKLNKLGQRHQIAREMAAEEEAIRHLRFSINTLISEENRHKTKLDGLKGRGGP